LRDAAPEKPRFGPFELIRPLEPGPLSERWLARHEFDHTSHVVHYFAERHNRSCQRRFLEAIEAVAVAKSAHLLAIERFGVCPGGRGAAVTPFTGNHQGLVTLAALLELKGGRMSPTEAERAITHILEGVEAGAPIGGNGPVTLDQVLVDRHGRAAIEFYGLGPRLKGAARTGPESVRDEIRSVVEIGYRVLTGLEPEEPRVPVSRLERRLPRAWEAWLERGLDPVSGFATVEEALLGLPSRENELESAGSPGPVRVLLSRLRRPSRAR